MTTTEPILLDTYPGALAPQKPEQRISGDELSELLARGAHASKKYNGNRVHILRGGESIRIYSRNGTLEWTQFLPRTVAAVAELNLPPHTYLDAELYIPAAEGRIESTQALQRVINPEGAMTEAGIATARQAEAALGPRLAVFDILVHGGEACHQDALARRLERLAACGIPQALGLVHLVEQVTVTSLEQALALVEARGWEGLVVASLHAPHKVNFNGNTKRGDSFKIKPRFTEEFCVVHSTASKVAGLGVGTLVVTNRRGRRFTIGTFDLEYDRQGMLGRVGYLVEVAHFGYDEDTGGLNFPKVLRVRTDITLQEWSRS